MSTQSLITEEMRRTIGQEFQRVTVEVEKGAIIRFAQAIGDPNPLWQDEVQARKSRYGGIIAPPTFLRSVRISVQDLPFEIPLKRVLDAGSEWEYFEPVRPGDRITASARLVDVRQREGRLGTMLFFILEITYMNQLDQVVAKQRATLIRY